MSRKMTVLILENNQDMPIPFDANNFNLRETIPRDKAFRQGDVLIYRVLNEKKHIIAEEICLIEQIVEVNEQSNTVVMEVEVIRGA